MSMEGVSGGQTKTNESGWTVDTLHAHLNTVLNERAIYLERVFNERDLRYQAKFTAQQTAVDKAERELELWKKTNNEWRGAMQDKDRLLMSRQEINSEINSTRTEISILRTSVGSLRNLSLTAILVACAVITVVLLLVQHKS